MPTSERFSARMGARGRVVLPKAVRDRLELREGDRLVLTVDQDGDVRLSSARQIAERFHGFFSDQFPGRSLAEELIAERREEARREGG
jgi:AbrB family looped-hinge helix DNA binding protein